MSSADKNKERHHRRITYYFGYRIFVCIALYDLISSSSNQNQGVQLSEAQIAIPELSEEDIKNNRLLSQEEMDAGDLDWLKSL